jgi:hypothetical protein
MSQLNATERLPPFIGTVHKGHDQSKLERHAMPALKEQKTQPWHCLAYQGLTTDLQDFNKNWAASGLY